MSRVFDQGYPWDICYDTRFQTLLRNKLPTSTALWMTEKKINEWFNHAHYGLQLRDSNHFKEPFVNDELPSRIICGYVVVKPMLTEFTETSAIFDDGSIEENIDVVVFATGYNYSFPFLDESIIKVDDKVHLYKSVFPKNLEKATLGVIGLIQPIGGIMTVSEMQARWITRVFKEYSLQLDYIEYLDEIAQEIGCKPNILGLLVTDPFLALKVVFGPCTPAQYRLRGPGQWPMARKQIMTTFDRILKPTKTRVVRTHKEKLSIVYGLCALCILALLLALA
ncbi:hypothetical protein AB205_0204940, partial [Aquarana catesbeiana]